MPPDDLSHETFWQQLLRWLVDDVPEAVAAALGEFAGTPVAGDDDPAGEVNAGELGEVRFRGPIVTPGYWNAPGETEAAFLDGWFRTGDVATIDQNGDMEIVDRVKDLIKSGGEWISSIELENLAMTHPAISQAAAVPARHPKWDERPLLVIVKKKGAEVSKDDVLKHLEGKIAKWWMPNDVVFVEEIPHTATGKIQKMDLREQFKDFEFSN